MITVNVLILNAILNDSELYKCVFVIIAVVCNESVYTERSGEITSADFPKPYPKSSDCTYRIELEEGFQISLEFDDTFDIEDHPEVTCPYDFIKVRVLLQFFFFAVFFEINTYTV